MELLNPTRLDVNNGSVERSVAVPLGNNPRNNQEISEAHDQVQEQYIFQEATIYLDKGLSNEKYHTFNEEQADKARFMCYLIAHTTTYKVLDVIASFVLLALAAIEPPAMLGMSVPIWIHAVLELSSLLIIVVAFCIKIKWQGTKYSRKHKRTIFKAILIIVMFAEIIAVLIREESHVRVTRALRPLFLLDTHYFRGARRVFREILKSIPPALDIFALLLFFMVIFAMLGFYFFSTNGNDPNFSTYMRSFISLFVLITTANFPDVMMPAYNQNKAAVFFFVTYISIALYFFMNLLLATVYSTFTTKNNAKFKRLYLHRREGARCAYKKICDPVNGGIDSHTFRRFMNYFKPRMSMLSTELAFKHLNKSRSGKINLKEFYEIYGATKLSWRRVFNGEWFYNWKLPKPLTVVLERIHLLVTKPCKKTVYAYFDICIYVVILINGCFVMYEIIEFSGNRPEERDFGTVHWYSHIFTAIYALEAFLKILALGPCDYFNSYWNCFDLLVTILNILGSLDQNVAFAIYLRPIRLLLLFKLKKSYRVVFYTLRILLSSLFKLGIIIVLFYYFFAILGIECFSGLDLKSCCRNLSIASEYGEGGYYYLNNFNDLFHSFVTLFELTVINNWHVIMEGFVDVTNDWSRIFFMVFYLVILVVTTIVVAFILDAFVFCIELQKKNPNNNANTYKVVFQTYLTKNELEEIDKNLVRANEERVVFAGHGFLTRDNLFEQMHKEELEESCKDQDRTLTRLEQGTRDVGNSREMLSTADTESSSPDDEDVASNT